MNKETEAKTSLHDPGIKAGTNDRSDLVVARVPQGYDTKINIRIVPGRDFKLTPDAPGCQPRQGAPRRDVDPVALPEGLAGKLKDANMKVINWLAQNAANAKLFLAQPVEALMKAGIDLSRSEQKTLDRAHRVVAEVSVVGPGVKILDLSASAHPTGRVGELIPGEKFKDGRAEGCGCKPKGKE